MLRWLAVVALLGCGRDKDNAIATKIAAAAARLPGLQITVEHEGEVVLDAQYGYADVENKAPVTADTVFCIGSNSKQFGAAAIMQLVEVGKLSLDDKLEKFFPGYPRGERITIRDLLRHTSGIEDFEYDGPWPPVMSIERTTDEMIAMFRDRRARFEPNTRWGYSTSNYILLGEIIAKVSGKPLREYMRENVWGRAGLEHTQICDTYELIPNRAHGYDTKDGKLVPTALQILEQFSVGGGICSTTHDMLRWQKALESGKVVSAATYQQMITPLPLADGTPTSYGYGLFNSQIAGHRVISHEGNVSGFTSMLYHFIDDDLRIAAVTNHRNMSPPWWDAANTVLRIGTAVAVPIAPAQLARYEKNFPFVTYEVKLVVDGDHLAHVHLDPEKKEVGRVPLVHVGNHTFERADRLVRYVYTLDGDRVTQLAWHAGGMAIYTRY